MPKFNIGDPVTFINCYGVKFPELKVVGVEESANGGEQCYFVEPHEASWASVRESQLIADADDPVIGVVGGHKLRNVLFEDAAWFLVGTTRNIFRTFGLAEQFAQQNPLREVYSAKPM